MGWMEGSPRQDAVHFPSHPRCDAMRRDAMRCQFANPSECHVRTSRVESSRVVGEGAPAWCVQQFARAQPSALGRRRQASAQGNDETSGGAPAADTKGPGSGWIGGGGASHPAAGPDLSGARWLPPNNSLVPGASCLGTRQVNVWSSRVLFWPSGW